MLLVLLAGCATTGSPGGADALIASKTVAGLNHRTMTREDCNQRLGPPSYVGSQGQFLAYERTATYRNLSRSQPAGPRTGTAPAATTRPDVIYYQIVGVWLDSAGHVLQTKELLAPCASCVDGEMLFNADEIDQWMRGTRPTDE
jgi:hypothetical protein